MKKTSLFRYQAIDASGVISGARARFRQGRANGVIYNDKAGLIPARNPLPADSLGRIVAYLPEGEEFEVTITRPDGSFVEQFDSTAVVGGVIIEREASERGVAEKEVLTVDPRQVEEIKALEKRLADAERALQAAEAKKAIMDSLERRTVSEPVPEPETVPEGPPAGIADLFHPDRPYAEQAHALWKMYNELTNKIMMKLATDDELKKHEKLQGELDWIKRYVFEGI